MFLLSLQSNNNETKGNLGKAKTWGTDVMNALVSPQGCREAKGRFYRNNFAMFFSLVFLATLLALFPLFSYLPSHFWVSVDSTRWVVCVVLI